MKDRKTIYIYVIYACLAALLFLCGCTGGKEPAVVTGQFYHPSAESTETEESGNGKKESVPDADLYMIISNDMTAEQFRLRQLASGVQSLCEYSLSTQFLDKYGDVASVSEFEPGRIIHIGKKDSRDKLTEAQLADEVWEYADITKYSIDEERRIFQIADSKYSYTGDLFVESDGKQLGLSDLNGTDEIRAVGIGTRILSVSVTAGHGTLKLTNTDLFEGSYIKVGTKIFALITKNMELEIPEGTYDVTVANEGYGGSTEVMIERGGETELDLDGLKGEGPKTGQILFLPDVEGAEIKIDGEIIDYSKPVELTYGIHSIRAEAEGYEDYSKKLFVNSAAADVEVAMAQEQQETEETEETEEPEETESVLEESTGTEDGTQETEEEKTKILLENDNQER